MALRADSESVAACVAALHQALNFGVKETWVHVLRGLPPREAALTAARAMTQPAPSFVMLLQVRPSSDNVSDMYAQHTVALLDASALKPEAMSHYCCRVGCGTL
jgi:hypothetical protein